MHMQMQEHNNVDVLLAERALNAFATRATGAQTDRTRKFYLGALLDSAHKLVDVVADLEGTTNPTQIAYEQLLSRGVDDRRVMNVSPAFIKPDDAYSVALRARQANLPRVLELFDAMTQTEG